MDQTINLLDDLKKSLSRLQKKDYEYFLQNWKPSVAGGRPLEELLDDEFFESIQKLQKRQFVQTLARLFHVEVSIKYSTVRIQINRIFIA